MATSSLLDTKVSYSFHEYCLLFPAASHEVFDGLVADILQNGLLEPVLLFEGQILDGRTRYLACKSISPNYPIPYKEFLADKSEAFKYVISRNLHRRHLTDIQRATLIALASDKSGEYGTLKGRAKLANVGEKVQGQAETVVTQLPEFVPKMMSGDTRFHPSLLTPLVKNQEKRKRAKELLDTNQINKLMHLLRGKGFIANATYRSEIYKLKHESRVPSLDKMTVLITEITSFINRFDEVRSMFEELAKSSADYVYADVFSGLFEMCQQFIPTCIEHVKEIHSETFVRSKDQQLYQWNKIINNIRDNGSTYIRRHIPSSRVSKVAVAHTDATASALCKALSELLNALRVLIVTPADEYAALDQLPENAVSDNRGAHWTGVTPIPLEDGMVLQLKPETTNRSPKNSVS